MKRCPQKVWTCYWPTSLWWAWQPCKLPAFPAKQLKQFRGEGIVEDGVQADSPQAFDCSLWRLWGKSLNHTGHWVLKQQEISRQGKHNACQTFFVFCLYFFLSSMNMSLSCPIVSHFNVHFVLSHVRGHVGVLEANNRAEKSSFWILKDLKCVTCEIVAW